MEISRRVRAVALIVAIQVTNPDRPAMDGIASVSRFTEGVYLRVKEAGRWTTACGRMVEAGSGSRIRGQKTAGNGILRQVKAGLAGRFESARPSEAIVHRAYSSPR